MPLKQPCQHGAYDPHAWTNERTGEVTICPGGTLLPPGSLVIVKEDGERRIKEVIKAWAPDLNGYAVERFTAELLDALAAAQPGTETVTTFEAFNVHVQEAP